MYNTEKNNSYCKNFRNKFREKYREYRREYMRKYTLQKKIKNQLFKEEARRLMNICL